MSQPRYFPHLYVPRPPEFELRRRVAYEQPEIDALCLDIFGEAYAEGEDRDFFRTLDSHVTLLDSREVAAARKVSSVLRRSSLAEVEDTLINWVTGYEHKNFDANGVAFARADGKGCLSLGIELRSTSPTSIEADRQKLKKQINYRNPCIDRESHGKLWLYSQPQLTVIEGIDPVADAEIVSKFFDRVPRFAGSVALEEMWLEQPHVDFTPPDIGEPWQDPFPELVIRGL